MAASYETEASQVPLVQRPVDELVVIIKKGNMSDSIVVLDDMPDEVLLNVFSNLESSTLLNTIPLVSKKFKNVSQDPSLWTKIVYKAKKYPLSLTGPFENFLLRATKLKTLLLITDSIDMKPRTFPLLKLPETMVLSATLETLKIRRAQISLKFLIGLRDCFPNLKSLELDKVFYCSETHGYLSELKYLELKDDWGSVRREPKIASIFESLTTFSVKNSCFWLCKFLFENGIKNCRHLEKFKIKDHLCDYRLYGFDKVFLNNKATLKKVKIKPFKLEPEDIKMLAQCQQLSSLQFKSISEHDDSVLLALQHLRLKTLKLENSLHTPSPFTSSALRQFFSNLERQHLLNLRISDNIHCEDSVLKIINEYCPNLQKMTFWGLPNVTVNSKHLFDSDPNHFNKYQFVDCPKVSSELVVLPLHRLQRDYSKKINK